VKFGPEHSSQRPEFRFRQQASAKPAVTFIHPLCFEVIIDGMQIGFLGFSESACWCCFCLVSALLNLFFNFLRNCVVLIFFVLMLLSSPFDADYEFHNSKRMLFLFFEIIQAELASAIFVPASCCHFISIPDFFQLGHSLA
jgi:hypothetical protein